MNEWMTGKVQHLVYTFVQIFWLFGNSRETDLHGKSSKYGISSDVSDFITFWLLWLL